MNEDMRSVLKAVTKGNPGAMRVFFELLEQQGGLAGIDCVSLVAQGITGSEVWYLYKDCCNYDIAAFHESVMNNTAIAKLEAVPDSRFYKPKEEEKL